VLVHVCVCVFVCVRVCVYNTTDTPELSQPYDAL